MKEYVGPVGEPMCLLILFFLMRKKDLQEGCRCGNFCLSGGFMQSHYMFFVLRMRARGSLLLLLSGFLVWLVD